MKIRCLLLISIFTVLFGGCEESGTVAILELSESSFDNIKNDGETLEVTVNCSSSWTISNPVRWCKVTPQEGFGDQKIKLLVEANLETDKRTAEIKISSDGISKTIRLNQNPANSTAGEYHYEIPVIFHVFYQDKNDPLQYVEQSRLAEILNQVNKLYKNKAGSVDMNLTFTLASTDPNGETLTTPGVKYTPWPYSYPIDCDKFMKDDNTNGGVGYVDYLWDPNQYINVMIYNFTEDPVSKTTTLGISHLPFTTTGSNSLVGLNEVSESYLQLENLSFPYCCSINSLFIFQQSDLEKYNPADVTVTLAHELGHYLGLHHVFSETNEGDLIDDCKDTDYCDDTPSYDKNAYDMYYAWAIKNIGGEELFSTLVKRKSCDGTEFISRNIMDYSVCYSDQFSQDQRNRIRHVLTYSPLIPGPKKGQAHTRTTTQGVLKLPIRTIK